MIDDTLMILSGLFVLAFRRDKWHWILWGALILYWMLGGFIQDLIGTNSIPYFNAPLALLAGYAGVYTAQRNKTFWPLIIASMMVLSVLNDAWYIIITELTDNDPRRLYQNACYLLYYFSLFALCHPTIRICNDERNNWIYS